MLLQCFESEMLLLGQMWRKDLVCLQSFLFIWLRGSHRLLLPCFADVCNTRPWVPYPFVITSVIWVNLTVVSASPAHHSPETYMWEAVKEDTCFGFTSKCSDDNTENRVVNLLRCCTRNSRPQHSHYSFQPQQLYIKDYIDLQHLTWLCL